MRASNTVCCIGSLMPILWYHSMIYVSSTLLYGSEVFFFWHIGWPHFWCSLQCYVIFIIMVACMLMHWYYVPIVTSLYNGFPPLLIRIKIPFSKYLKLSPGRTKESQKNPMFNIIIFFFIALYSVTYLQAHEITTCIYVCMYMPVLTCKWVSPCIATMYESGVFFFWHIGWPHFWCSLQCTLILLIRMDA